MVQLAAGVSSNSSSSSSSALHTFLQSLLPPAPANADRTSHHPTAILPFSAQSTLLASHVDALRLALEGTLGQKEKQVRQEVQRVELVLGKLQQLKQRVELVCEERDDVSAAILLRSRRIK